MSSFKGKGAARSPETTPKKELVLPSSYPATWVLVVRAPHDSPAVKWQDWKSFQQDIRQHIKYQPGETHVIVLPELETKIALCELEKKEEADRAFAHYAAQKFDALIFQLHTIGNRSMVELKEGQYGDKRISYEGSGPFLYRDTFLRWMAAGAVMGPQRPQLLHTQQSKEPLYVKDNRGLSINVGDGVVLVVFRHVFINNAPLNKTESDIKNFIHAKTDCTPLTVTTTTGLEETIRREATTRRPYLHIKVEFDDGAQANEVIKKLHGVEWDRTKLEVHLDRDVYDLVGFVPRPVYWS